MPTVLVTGATGLIGANICRRLRERGHTKARLGHTPLRLDEGLRRTLDWLEATRP